VSKIHETALVDPAAEVAGDAEIGPFSVIGPKVRIGAGSWIGAHVVVTGRTTIGENTRIFHSASIGEEPQDKKYGGEDTELIIGDNNTIRELCTFSRGRAQGGGKTVIGNNNWIMACVHIAHDCRIGSHAVLANNTTLAGHVHIGDYTTLGGASLVHQFCRIGEHAFTAYGARINKDVPPFVMVCEGKARPRGLNVEGLKRRGFAEQRIRALKEAYRILYRSEQSLEQAIVQLKQLESESDDVRRLRSFVEACERSIVR